MILLLQEDQILRIYESPEDVPTDIEAVDIEDTAVVICDEAGRRYEVEWIKPFVKWHFLGIIPIVGGGVYRIRQVGNPDFSVLEHLLSRAYDIYPKNRFNTVFDLRRHLHLL